MNRMDYQPGQATRDYVGVQVLTPLPFGGSSAIPQPRILVGDGGLG